MYAKTHADVPLSPTELEVETAKIREASAAFGAVCQAKMMEKVREGWRGWDDPANRQEIYHAMLAHGTAVPLAAGQEIAIANFAMFLWMHRVKKDPAAVARADFDCDLARATAGGG